MIGVKDIKTELNENEFYLTLDETKEVMLWTMLFLDSLSHMFHLLDDATHIAPPLSFYARC